MKATTAKKPLTIKHRSGQYPVEFLTFDEIRDRIPADAHIVTDEHVARYWGPKLGSQRRILSFPPGEQTKSIRCYERILNWLADCGCTRDGILVAFGGGVVGDIAGFAAATYMRGIRLFQVPTTLMAQVDSAIGGKVAIDLPQGKNLVGTFYAPERVLISVETLTTLPQQEFRNGMAEVWKYSFILDPELAQLLRKPSLTPTAKKLEAAIRRCIELKAKIVERDELDSMGERAVLNFGHTIGHALELIGGFAEISHGEAISIGMAVEARIGEIMGVTQSGTANKIEKLLAGDGLPTAPDPLLRPQDIMRAMRLDKKGSSGNLAMSLLVRMGKCKLVSSVPLDAVEGALRPK